jgi:hypothetical protein
MEHFSDIYDVCRAAMAGDTAMATRSVKSLRDALAASGDAEDAVLLARLVKATSGKSSARRSAHHEKNPFTGLM